MNKTLLFYKFTLILVAFFASTNLFAQAEQDYFITTWNTSLSSNNPTSIKFYGVGENYKLVWENINDPTLFGEVIVPSSSLNTPYELTVPVEGEYRLKVVSTDESTSTFTKYMQSYLGKRALTSIEQWGTVAWEQFQFKDCPNLDVIATDVPNLSSATSLSRAFMGCSSLLNANKSLEDWDVSAIVDFTAMFGGATVYNANLNSWDVSSAESLSGMFYNTDAFNGNISSWNVSNVTDMSEMFAFAKSFNQDISGWDVSNVESMSQMFFLAKSFNQDISGWNVSNVQDMNAMFAFANSFNQNLGEWSIPENSIELLFSSGLDCSNYSSSLNGWHNQGLENVALNNEDYANELINYTEYYDVELMDLSYGSHASLVRRELIANGWTIERDTSAGVALEFPNLPTNITVGDPSYTLPPSTTSGTSTIEGTWYLQQSDMTFTEVTEINTDEVGLFTYMFIPNDSNCSYQEFLHEVSIDDTQCRVEDMVVNMVPEPYCIAKIEVSIPLSTECSSFSAILIDDSGYERVIPFDDNGSTVVFDELEDGDYNVKITDGIDTYEYANNPVTVETVDVPYMEINAEAYPPACEGEGAIVIVSVGNKNHDGTVNEKGVGPWVYTLGNLTSPETYETEYIFTGLDSEATYSYAVEDHVLSSGLCKVKKEGTIQTLPSQYINQYWNVKSKRFIECSDNCNSSENKLPVRYEYSLTRHFEYRDDEIINDELYPDLVNHYLEGTDVFQYSLDNVNWITLDIEAPMREYDSETDFAYVRFSLPTLLEGEKYYLRYKEYCSEEYEYIGRPEGYIVKIDPIGSTYEDFEQDSESDACSPKYTGRFRWTQSSVTNECEDANYMLYQQEDSGEWVPAVLADGTNFIPILNYPSSGFPWGYYVKYPTKQFKVVFTHPCLDEPREKLFDLLKIKPLELILRDEPAKYYNGDIQSVLFYLGRSYGDFISPNPASGEWNIKITPESGVSEITTDLKNPFTGDFIKTHTFKFPIETTLESYSKSYINELPIGQTYSFVLTDYCGDVYSNTITLDEPTNHILSLKEDEGFSNGIKLEPICDRDKIKLLVGYNFPDREMDDVEVYRDGRLYNGLMDYREYPYPYNNNYDIEYTNIRTGEYTVRFFAVYDDDYVVDYSNVSRDDTELDHEPEYEVPYYEIPVSIKEAGEFFMGVEGIFCGSQGSNSGDIIPTITSGALVYPVTVTLEKEDGSYYDSYTLDSPVEQLPLFEQLSAGRYIVTIKDQCLQREQYYNLADRVDNSEKNAKATRYNVCVSDNELELYVEASSYIYDIEWKIGEELIGTGSRITVTPTQSTTYNVTLELADGIPCLANIVASQSSTVTVTVNEDPITNQKLSIVDLCSFDGDGQFTISGTQSTFIYELLNENGDSFDPAVRGIGTGGDLTITIPVANMPSAPKNYFVKVISIVDGKEACSLLLENKLNFVTTPPVILLPDLETLEVGANCVANETFEVTVSNKCDIKTIEYSINEEEITFPYDFEIGETVVDVVATNIFNQSSTASFTVTVTDTTAPIINCPADINVTVDSDVVSSTVEWTEVKAFDNCDVTITSTHISSESFPVGNTTVTYMAVDSSGNLSTCSFIVTVNQKPPLQCDVDAPDIEIINATCTSSGTVTIRNFDSKASYTMSNGLRLQGNKILDFELETPYFINVTKDNCTVSVGFEVALIDDNSAPIITLPNITEPLELGDGCVATATYEATATDPCGISELIYDIDGEEISFPYLFEKGITVVNVTAIDGSNNSSTASFTVTVQDTTPPVIDCPTDITVNVDAGIMSATVNWEEVSYEDNCDVILTSSHNSGDSFPIGNTTVTYMAEDSSGNMTTCSFIVTVNQNPPLECDLDVPELDINEATCTSSATVSITNLDKDAKYEMSDGLSLEGSMIKGFSLGQSYVITVVKDNCTVSVSFSLSSLEDCDKDTDGDGVVDIEDPEPDNPCVPYQTELPEFEIREATCNTNASVIITNYDYEAIYELSGELILDEGVISNFELGVVYEIKVTKNNCTASTSFILTPIEEDCGDKIDCEELWSELNNIPQVISPNGDGFNDEWDIKYLKEYSINCANGSRKNVIYIFNRWGALVYEKENYMLDNERFNGYSEKGVVFQEDKLLPAGVYFYILKINGREEKNGYIYILLE